jgi:hypothetical protein
MNYQGQKFRTERQLDPEEGIYSLELYVVTDDPGSKPDQRYARR